MDTLPLSFIDRQNRPRVRSGQCIDKKSGKIYVVFHKGDKKQRLQVYMKIIANIYEHHAQIYSDSNYSLQMGCLSLRNCVVTSVPNHPNCINVAVGSPSTDQRQGVVFESVKLKDTAEWIKALTPAPSLFHLSERPRTDSPMMIRAMLRTFSKARLSILADEFNEDFSD